MITTLLRSQTLAALPNSRWNTPMVPGPQTSCVIRTSACTQTLSPASTRALPDARASIVSVNVINQTKLVDRAPDFNTEYRAASRAQPPGLRDGRVSQPCGTSGRPRAAFGRAVLHRYGYIPRQYADHEPWIGAMAGIAVGWNPGVGAVPGTGRSPDRRLRSLKEA